MKVRPYRNALAEMVTSHLPPLHQQLKSLLSRPGGAVAAGAIDSPSPVVRLICQVFLSSAPHVPRCPARLRQLIEVRLDSAALPNAAHCFSEHEWKSKKTVRTQSKSCKRKTWR
jgi:hypothetical protein